MGAEVPIVDYIGIESDKYLGDILANDQKNRQNINSKVAKGMGIVTEIMNLLNDISLGTLYFEIAMALRESMFVN